MGKGSGKGAKGRNGKGRNGTAGRTKKSKVAGIDVPGVEDVAPAPVSFTEALRAGPGFSLTDLDPRSTPGFDGDKADGEVALAARAGEISGFQEKLYAEFKGEGGRSLLL